MIALEIEGTAQRVQEHEQDAYCHKRKIKELGLSCRRRVRIPTLQFAHLPSFSTGISIFLHSTACEGRFRICNAVFLLGIGPRGIGEGLGRSWFTVGSSR